MQQHWVNRMCLQGPHAGSAETLPHGPCIHSHSHPVKKWCRLPKASNQNLCEASGYFWPPIRWWIGGQNQWFGSPKAFVQFTATSGLKAVVGQPKALEPLCNLASAFASGPADPWPEMAVKLCKVLGRAHWTHWAIESHNWIQQRRKKRVGDKTNWGEVYT